MLLTQAPSDARVRLVDTHVHLDRCAHEGSSETPWARAQQLGVVAALAVGVAPGEWDATIAAARAARGVSIALGIHPQVVPSLDDDALARALSALPDRLRACSAVAIGECGLDLPAGDLDRQRRALLAQLDVARACHLPVSLHVFRAHPAMLELLRDLGPLPAGGVVHSYSGSAELVRSYLAAGLSISFAGAITRSNARKPLLAARAVPPEHLLIETDAPYQPAGPDARDRKEGGPGDLPQILAALAAARGDDPNALAETTTANALRIYRGLQPTR